MKSQKNGAQAPLDHATSASIIPAITTDYAIFQTGGKQYQGIPGKTVAIELLDAAVGQTVTFDQVLLKKTALGSVEIGQPFVNSGPITASIVKHMRGPKVIVFKFKRRKKSRVKKGHRQSMTIVRINAF